jgi:hypothetical protein
LVSLSVVEAVVVAEVKFQRVAQCYSTGAPHLRSTHTCVCVCVCVCVCECVSVYTCVPLTLTRTLTFAFAAVVFDALDEGLHLVT